MSIIDFITPITTIVVGLIAIYVYLGQKQDIKRDAARVILDEIQNAEKQVRLILSSTKPSELPKIFTMPSHSWERYKYHFINNFDQNEKDKISEFYARCLKYDRAVEYNDSFFGRDIEQIRNNAHRLIADIAKEYTEAFPDASTVDTFTVAQKELTKKFVDKRKTFDIFYANDKFFYSPVQPINDATDALKSLETSLSITTIGTKLGKLSKEGVIFNKVR